MKISIAKSNIFEENAWMQEYYSLAEKDFAQIPWITRIRQYNPHVYCLLNDDGNLMGGITLFDESPESPEINAKKIDLLGNEGIFISILFIKSEFRKNNYGPLLIKHLLKETSKDHSYAWGIIESERIELINYYRAHLSITVCPINETYSVIQFFTST